MMTITVVTPWWGCPELAPAYEAAIVAGKPDEVIVSDDGSHPWVKLSLPDVRYVRATRHQGFARACNAGLHAASTDAVLFLNNDVVHTGPGWLHHIRESLRPGVLVGASLRIDQHTAVDGQRYPYLDGWCVAGMRADLLDLGGWDDSLEEPAYYGDNLLSLDARARGMKLVRVPVALRHLGNYTTRRMDVTGASARNRARYVARVRELQAVAA